VLEAGGVDLYNYNDLAGYAAPIKGSSLGERFYTGKHLSPRGDLPLRLAASNNDSDGNARFDRLVREGPESALSRRCSRQRGVASVAPKPTVEDGTGTRGAVTAPRALWGLCRAGQSGYWQDDSPFRAPCSGKPTDQTIKPAWCRQRSDNPWR
jgi:hypothetical protein